MRREDVKIGMKVVPFQKTQGEIRAKGIDLKCYMDEFFKGKKYLEVVEIMGDRIGLWSHKDRDTQPSRDFFSAEDFEPYIEPKQTKKETQQMKKEEPAQLNKREKGRKVKELREKLNIKRMLRNGDTLIVWFEDGTEKGHKVVEKCVGKDEFDIEIGISLAYLHHIAGSKSVFKEAVEKEVKTKLTVVKGE